MKPFATKTVESEHMKLLEAVKAYINCFAMAVTMADVNDMAALATAHAFLRQYWYDSQSKLGCKTKQSFVPDSFQTWIGIQINNYHQLQLNHFLHSNNTHDREN